MDFFSDLEEEGDATTGDALDANPQTLGGATDIVFTRTYKVRANVATNYLFQILSTTSAPTVRVTDKFYSNAYLVRQRMSRIDQVNNRLTCVFAQIPATWRSDVSY